MSNHSLSIRAKLLTATAVTSALFLFALFYSLSGTGRVTDHFYSFIDTDQKRLETLRTMQAEGAQVVIAAAKKMLVPSLKPPKKVAIKAADTFDKALATATKLYAGDKKGSDHIKQITALWTECRPLALKTIDLVDQEQPEEAKALFTGKVQKLWGGVRKQIQPLVQEEIKRVAQTRAQVEQEVSGVIWMGTLLGLVALLATVAFNYLVSGRISGNVRRVAEGLEDIAEGGGDLTARLPEEGGKELEHLARAFNQFASETQLLIRQVMDATNQMNSISGDLSHSALESRDVTSQQQEAMEQVATAMTQMSSAVKSVAESASHAASAAEDADHQANKASRTVADTIAAIEHLAQDVEGATETMASLERETEQVSNVLSVIRGIAEQTNLLALNAAIEAARAGEMGRGFAVVADEVRSLANRTQQSTSEVGDIIERLQAGATSTARLMNTSRDSVQQTVAQAAEVDQALNAVTNSVGQIRDMNTEIASAAEEQGAVTEDIQRNTFQVSELARQSADTANQTEQTGSELKSVSEQISGLMGRFTVS
jgi:methyl-accepting chemotaxis protein